MRDHVAQLAGDALAFVRQGHARAQLTFAFESQTRVLRACRRGADGYWHGVDLPNTEDGVAGITQDAVPAGHCSWRIPSPAASRLLSANSFLSGSRKSQRSERGEAVRGLSYFGDYVQQ